MAAVHEKEFPPNPLPFMGSKYSANPESSIALTVVLIIFLEIASSLFSKVPFAIK